MNLRGDITPAFSNTGTGPGEKSALQRALEGILLKSHTGIVDSTADDAGMVASLAGVLADPIRSGEAAGRSVRQALPAISQGVSNFVSQPPSEMLSSAGALGNAVLKSMQQGVEQRGIGGVASATDFVPAGMLAGALPLLADIAKVSKGLKAATQLSGVPTAKIRTSGGIDFETGKPVSFEFIRNTEKAPDMGSRFGQDIEPAGRFMQQREQRFDLPPNMEAGEITFNKPLVVEHVDTRAWKRALSEAYGGKTGVELSKALLSDGFDGIVTVDSKGNYASEIVDLGVIGAATNKAATPRQARLAELAEGVENPGALEGQALSRSPQVKTPEFKSFFGNSKVLNEDGSPQVVFKGMNNLNIDTGEPINEIQRQSEFPAFNSGEPGVNIGGFFSSEPKVADHFARHLSGGNAESSAPVFPVFLRIEKPFVIDAKGKPAGTVQFGREGAPFRDAIRSGKFDGVIIRNTSDEGDLYVTLSGDQAKSAIGNDGAFAPGGGLLHAAAPIAGGVGIASMQDEN